MQVADHGAACYRGPSYRQVIRLISIPTVPGVIGFPNPRNGAARSGRTSETSHTRRARRVEANVLSQPSVHPKWDPITICATTVAAHTEWYLFYIYILRIKNRSNDLKHIAKCQTLGRGPALGLYFTRWLHAHVRSTWKYCTVLGKEIFYVHRYHVNTRLFCDE